MCGLNENMLHALYSEQTSLLFFFSTSTGGRNHIILSNPRIYLSLKKSLLSLSTWFYLNIK